MRPARASNSSGRPSVTRPARFMKPTPVGTFFGEHPQQWAGIVSGQLDHSDPPNAAAAGHRHLAGGANVGHPVGAGESGDHVFLAVDRHRRDGSRSLASRFAAGRRQHDRALAAETQAQSRHLDEDLLAGLSHHGGRTDLLIRRPYSSGLFDEPLDALRHCAGPGCGDRVEPGERRRRSATTSPTPMFSSRWAIDRVPGINSVVGACASSHANPTCDGVTPSSPAIVDHHRVVRPPWGNRGTPTRAGSTAPRRCLRPCRRRAFASWERSIRL